MDNLNSPTYPFFTYNEVGYGDAIVVYDKDGGKQILPFTPGLTKLEKASLMIAQGTLASKKELSNDADFVKYCVNVAKAVLEESNKPEEESAVVKMLRAVTERLEWTTLYASFADDDQETEILLKAAKALMGKAN